MFILRLTSDPALRGLNTDDDFTIGIFSGATVFLVIITTVLGIIGALVYLVVRGWLPERGRPWLFGALTGIVGGATVIRPGGIDFTFLEPLGLAVAMFVVLPTAYGVATSLLAERFLADDSVFGRSRAWISGLVLLLPLGLFGVAGLAVLALVLAGVLVGRAAPAIASRWNPAGRLDRTGGPRGDRRRVEYPAREGRRRDPVSRSDRYGRDVAVGYWPTCTDVRQERVGASSSSRLGSRASVSRSASRSERSRRRSSGGGSYIPSMIAALVLRPSGVSTTSFTLRSVGDDRRSARPRSSRRSTIQVAFDASHAHSSARAPIGRPSPASRPPSALASPGVRP
jgi:hypothetical protein